MRLLATTALVMFSSTLFGGSDTFFIDEVVEYSEPLAVPGYNTANGPLRAVLLCLRFRQDRSVLGESLSNLPSTVDASFTGGELTLELNGTVLWDHQFNDEANQFTPAAFDGMPDLTGVSAFSWETVQGGFKTVVIDDPALLTQFETAGLVNLTVNGRGLFTKSGPGSILTDIESRIRTQGTVAYLN